MSEDLVAQLNRIFYPRAIAVIGASNTPRKHGRVFLEAFMKAGFKEIYPINPHEGEVLGLKAYPSITQVPVEIDYALIATPTPAVLQAVADCAEKGVAGATIFTSGFREKGPDGEKLERTVVEAARRGGTRLIGPNCMGIYCPASHLTISDGLPMLSGSVGFISHSGSLCVMISRMVLSRGLAVSKAVSCGNESDLTAADFLEYYGQDPDTKVVVAYMEDVKQGQRFLRVARDVSARKPVVILKGGLTERGARAAASHTGALAGSREIWQGACRQAGITLVRSGEELLDCLSGLAVSSLPAGRRVAIVSGPGGPAVVTADALVEYGLTLAELSQQTKDRVSQIVPSVGTSLDNPLDLGMNSMFAPEIYPETIKAAGADPNVDMILSIGGRGKNEAVFEAKKQGGKLLVVALSSFAPDLSLDEYRAFNGAGIPVLADPSRGARVLAALADRADFVKRAANRNPPAYQAAGKSQVVARAQSEGREALSEHDSKRLLASYGIPITREELVTSKRQALGAARRIGFPVGLKACGSHILHKTELGLIELDLKNAKEVDVAYDLLMERTEGMFPDGILVQEMVKGNREFVAGLVQDRQFGPCVMFGLGGIFTEALKDASFRVAPFDVEEALEMIGEIRAQPLLGAFRGSEPVDLDALAGILVALSRLAFEEEAVKEVDINPLIVGPDGKPVAVDALVALKTDLQKSLV